MTTQTEALKLALEALEDAQYFIEAELNDRMDLYKNYTNLAHKYAGEQESLRKNQESITAIKEALAQPEHHTLTSRVNDVRFHKERDEQRDEAMKMLSQPEQEPVAWLVTEGYATPNMAFANIKSAEIAQSKTLGSRIVPLYTTPPQPKEPEQEPVGEVVTAGVIRWKDKYPSLGTKLYTTPPQRKPLTGDALLSAAQSCLSPSQYDHFEALIENDQDAHNRLARAIENERGK